MTKRKLFLLASCAVLLCIYIVQLAASAKTGTKVYTLDGKAEIDTIKLSAVTGEYDITKEGDGWVVSAAKFPAAQSAVDSMISALKSVRVLEKVAVASDSNNTRYELGDDKSIKVTASGGGEVLRTLVIGKAASTSSQTYAAIDGGRDVCLVGGNLRSTFNKTVADLRSKIIYKLDSDKLNKVSVTYEGQTLTYEKAADSPEWKCADGTPEGDSDKVSNWASSLYSLTAAEWIDDDAELPASPIATARVESDGDFATVNVYRVDPPKEDASENDGEDDAESSGDTGGKAEPKYYCTSSATPYKAEISSYAAQKFMKTADDFAKDK